LAEIYPGYGISQVEPQSIVQKVPLQAILHAIKDEMRIASCIFTSVDFKGALLSSGAAISRCEVVSMLNPSEDNKEFLGKHGFTVDHADHSARMVHFKRSSSRPPPAAMWRSPTAFQYTEIALLLPGTPGVLKIGRSSKDRKVLLDIGLADSILEGAGPDTVVIAVDASQKEMLVNELVEMCHNRTDRCIFFHAALSNTQDWDPAGEEPLQNRVVQFWQTAREGGNSLDLPDKDLWPMDMGASLVPVLPLKVLLDAVPRQVPFEHCKTDTNGNDGRVLKSAAESIKRCPDVKVEFIVSGAAGPSCQKEAGFAFMERQGFDGVTRLMNDEYGYHDVLFTK